MKQIVPPRESFPVFSENLKPAASERGSSRQWMYQVWAGEGLVTDEVVASHECRMLPRNWDATRYYCSKAKLGLGHERSQTLDNSPNLET